MTAGATSLAVLLFLIAFLSARIHIFVAIICTCIISLMVFMGFDLDRIGATLSRIAIRASSSWELSAIPLFIWMGEIAIRTSVISRLFSGLIPFVRRLPGGLIHVNIIGCTLFAAVSGSSAATTASVGKITLGELKERGYNRSLSIGSLAGAGTLGLLIPPSMLMIIYGLLAEVSIIRLFAAGLIPGLMIATFYAAYVMVRSPRGAAVQELASEGSDAPIGLGRALLDLLPIMVLIASVMAAIYSGWATPSEAAAVGVLVTFLLAAILGEFSPELVLESLRSAVPVSCMICTILVAASFLSTTMGFLHIPQDVAKFIAGLGLERWSLLVVLAVFYLLLGLLLDGISITVMTLPISFPLIVSAGVDPVWFGVFLVIMVELGQMTPPVGFNLFILQSIAREPILWIARAALPFFLLMLGAVILLAIFPGIALWLPRMLFG